MNIRVFFTNAKGSEITTHLSDSQFSPWATQPGTRRAFVLDGFGGPDVLCLLRGTGGALLLRNGLMRKSNRAQQRGTLRGSVRVEINGKLFHEDPDVVIEDGESWALTAPDLSQKWPDSDWSSWALRDAAELWGPEAIAPKGALSQSLRSYFTNLDPHYKLQPGFDEPEPDAAGSARVCPSGWAGAFGAAYLRFAGLPIPPSYRAAEQDWTRLQCKKPIGYYDEQGEPYRFSAESDSWVDEHGPTDAGHGSYKRLSLAENDADDDEHLELKRLHAAAALWRNPLAVLLLDHWGEVLCSRPGSRFIKPSTNARGSARPIEGLALCASVVPDRPQFVAALRVRFEGVKLATGTDVRTGIPYCCPAPQKVIDEYAFDYIDDEKEFSHLFATREDAKRYCDEKGMDWPPGWDGLKAKELRAMLVTMAKARGLAADAYTSGPDGLDERYRGVLPAWLGALVAALEVAQSIPVAAEGVPGAVQLIRRIGECIEYGAKLSFDKLGMTAFPAPCCDSYAKGQPERATSVHIAWGGTMTWLAQGLAVLVRVGTPAQQTWARAMLIELRDKCSLAKLPHLEAVEHFWPALGMQA